MNLNSDSRKTEESEQTVRTAKSSHTENLILWNAKEEIPRNTEEEVRDICHLGDSNTF